MASGPSAGGIGGSAGLTGSYTSRSMRPVPAAGPAGMRRVSAGPGRVAGAGGLQAASESESSESAARVRCITARLADG